MILENVHFNRIGIVLVVLVSRECHEHIGAYNWVIRSQVCPQHADTWVMKLS